jgi:hypothetical protein
MFQCNPVGQCIKVQRTWVTTPRRGLQESCDNAVVCLWFHCIGHRFRGVVVQATFGHLQCA